MLLITRFREPAFVHVSSARFARLASDGSSFPAVFWGEFNWHPHLAVFTLVYFHGCFGGHTFKVVFRREK